MLGREGFKPRTFFGWTLILGSLVGVILHALGRTFINSRHTEESSIATKKMVDIYLYTRYERFWHRLQMVLIFLLLITGFEVHGL